ncbi:MAG: Dyp-type peroxidase [Rhizobiales bacterium]|nr:Dyp-type peroxidase [Hyphomicrobiales bacterium]
MLKSAPVLSEQLGDIQGMLKSGYGWLKTSRFWLLTVRDGREDQARAWLKELLKPELDLIVSAERVGEAKTKRIDEALAIAFSHAGLVKLGCEDTGAHPFPTPFCSGMGSRLRESLLNDSPRQWRWSDVEGCLDRQAVHILVAQWSLRDATTRMPDPDPEVFQINKVENNPYSFAKRNDDPEERLREPFGFRDGIAQPVILGLRDVDGESDKAARLHAGPLYEDRVVSPGEFILGYRNEYDELTYCPDVERWAQLHPGSRFTLNGSYLAVRQIEQYVNAFKELEDANDVSVCEKMIGRRKNGLPLSWKGNPDDQIPDSTADAFRYQVDDANGFMCPKGSHIRRMNPRDSLGSDVPSGVKASKLHRLLRRGRPYLEETADKDEPRQGIFFIACNADFERQFEFIHQRWMRNFRFGALHHEDDPIVGVPQQPSKTFTIPALPSGREVSLKDLTGTLGGGYFFLPGIKALNFIAESMRPAPRVAGSSAETATVR